MPGAELALTRRFSRSRSRLTLGIVLIALSLGCADGAHAKNPPGGKGVAETGQGGPDTICSDVSKVSKYLDRICIDKVQAKWVVGPLGREAIVFARARWMLWSGGDFGAVGVLHGKGHGDLRHHIHLQNAPKFVIDALDRLEITTMHIRGLVEPKYPEYEKGASSDELAALERDYRHFTQAYGASRFFIKLDPGALAGPGEWSFNVGGDVPWDKLFDQIQNCPGTHSRFLDTARAKSLFNLGFRIARLDICEFTVTGLSSVDYALEQSCLAWDVNSDKYRECMAECPPERRYKRYQSSRDRTATCSALPPLNLAKPPREKTPEDVEFAKLMEKELAAAAGIAPGPQATPPASGTTGGASSANSLQSQLMAAAGIGVPGSGSGSGGQGSTAPYGLTDAQWAKVQEERAAEKAGLVPKRERERNACYDSEPKRPEAPVQQLLTLWPNSCDDACRRRGQASIDQQNQAKLQDYREELKRYDRRLERWKRELKGCLAKAEENHSKRAYELSLKHKKDDTRLAEIERLNKQLMKTNP